MAYRIHLNVERGRWYLTASWRIPPVRTIPLAEARRGGLIGVDTNADHLAAWCLDQHGNPCGEPLRFLHDLSGNAHHRDAQVRHALTRLLHWAARHSLSIAIEDLYFAAEKTREKHGRRKRFRKLISGMPVSKLRARLVSMAAELEITIVAVDPAYTSKWGAEHWQKPMATPRRKTTRGREGTRPRIPGPRTRSTGAGYGANAGDQDTQHRSECPTEPVQPMLSL